MNCEFMWYNLDNKIKKDVIVPLKGIISDESFNKISKVIWYNLPNTLTKTFKILVQEYLDLTGNVYPITSTKFIWYNLPKKVSALCTLRTAIQATLPNPLFIEASSPKGFACIEETDEIQILGSGFLSATDVIINNLSVVSFEIVSDELIKAIPLLPLEYSATPYIVPIQVERGVELSNILTLEVTNNFLATPIQCSTGDLGETTVCLDKNLSFTNQTGLGIWKSSDKSVLEFTYVSSGLSDGVAKLNNPGEAYIYYDFNVSPTECGRKNFKVNVIQNIVVNKHPTDKKRLQGSDTSFKVEAIGVDSYQWQLSIDNGISWTNVINNGTYSGATTDTLIVNNITLAMNEYAYQCVLTPVSPCNELATYSATLSVREEIGILIDIQNTFEQTCLGDDVIFNVVVEGTPTSFTWYEDTGFEQNPITPSAQYYGEDTSTLTIINPQNNINRYNYYLVIESATETLQSNTASFNIVNC